ncbi:MAG: hypothetical protein ACHBN1_27040 [Heteroscytonema crispum UTEX LB 1556]
MTGERVPPPQFGGTQTDTLRASQSPGSGKRHLLHLGRPQDRSGSPTKGAKLAGGNLPDCRLSAVSPPTARLLQLARREGQMAEVYCRWQKAARRCRDQLSYTTKHENSPLPFFFSPFPFPLPLIPNASPPKSRSPKRLAPSWGPHLPLSPLHLGKNYVYPILDIDSVFISSGYGRT